MKKWIYETIEFNIGEINLDYFNALGEDGYELVSVIPRSYDSLAFFKKQLEDEPEPLEPLE